MQLQVTNSPFNQEQVDLLNRLLPSLTDSQKIWLSGFLAATASAPAASAAPLAAQQALNVAVAAPAPAASKDVTILFGSQSGNSAGFAKKSAKVLTENGFNVTVSSMSDFKTNQLKKVQQLLIVASTHGEGEPPDNAISFHEFLLGKRAPRLEGMTFSVLALGDTSYELFCQTGKEFDARLEELGATRLVDRVDCDVDFDEPASGWLKSVVDRLKEAGSAGTGAAVAAAPSSDAGTAAESAYSRTNPFRAEVLASLNLNGRGSNKETRHLELSLEGSGIAYKPGDALGIYPQNDPALVDELLEATKWDAQAQVTVNKNGEVRALREALIDYFDITTLSKPLAEKLAQIAANKEALELFDASNREKFKAYAHGRDLLDFIRDYGPLQGSAQDVVSLLRKIPARLYSIASAQSANPDEVHLTIGAVRYEAHGRERKGVCSVYAAERLQPGDTVPVYIQPNDNFKLPEDPSTPIIMVGPGTGIAPFRSFMQEREESGAEGPSWLFFGDQHFVTDFLYQTEWQRWIKDGVLTRMDVAFSRDTEDKVYVQHRMLQHGKELFAWLEQGASFYICGDEKNMAKDVHRALLEIIETEGGKSREEAENYLASMQQSKRYQRDVY
ncbi:assimilatory sulfite reductase (NADPH) flavoprotein subunit [Paenibacillus methanolicus]|uniref:assimilatory sulfite reductase (NADPH) n=1 Tax=Paenibacillus methanolicus TaxID=582686 RepID=A0A5S5CDJ8_9BACL|nr:assimilatory sulfite reductase (NADPH) flavoprotein subunit [Paenibacillus methanolicus]TYP76396.1 sulfite reductase (NADPH) flavoprotein alpha-component [Paenibacillus methanolicus]